MCDWCGFDLERYDSRSLQQLEIVDVDVLIVCDVEAVCSRTCERRSA